MGKKSRKVFIWLFSVWFATVNSLGTVANAQVTEGDFEAPIIEIEEITSGVLGDDEKFAATVVDNEELKSVSFFYRYAGESDFKEITMQPLVQSFSYSATVKTGERTGKETAIEYYFRAEDEAGNVVLKGLSFDPLIRSLIDPAATAPSSTASVDQTPPIEASSKRGINWLYVGLGVLLVGGLAAAGGGSSGGGGGGGGGGEVNDCDPNCNITLTLSPPN